MFIPSSTHRRKVNGFDCWQEKVGKWLGFVSVVNVFDNPILTKEECTLITAHMSMFANNALLGGGVGVRFGLENKERSKEDQRHY